MNSRRLVAAAALLVAVSSLLATSAFAAAPATMADETSYDVLTYSAWGRQNGVTGAQCTGQGRAGKTFLGATHALFRCDVFVNGVQGGTVVAKVLGPESLRVVSVASGKLAPDRGIGAVPKGAPTLQNFDALTALQTGAWGKAHRIGRALCYGVGPYRSTSVTSTAFFFAFSCATFDRRDARGPQLLVVATGKRSVRVVRTLAR